MLVEEAGDDIRASACVDSLIRLFRLGAVESLVMYAVYCVFSSSCLSSRGVFTHYGNARVANVSSPELLSGVLIINETRQRSK